SRRWPRATPRPIPRATLSLPRVLAALDAVLLQLLVEGRGGDAQDLGGPGAIAGAVAQGLLDGRLLQRLQRLAGQRQLLGGRGRPGGGGRLLGAEEHQVLRLQAGAV